jgi:hypothetical protein
VGVDLASLAEALVASNLPVVGVAYCTTEAMAAHVPAQAPVAWVGLADAEVRLDLTRELTPEEQTQALDLVVVWSEAL